MIIRKAKIILLIVLWGLTFHLKGQIHTSYTVIKVNGKVVSKILNRELTSGDMVRPDDRLTFDSKEAYVHIISAEGVKTIRHVPDHSPRELVQLMQTFLSPEKRSKVSRGSPTDNLEQIKKELSYDTLLILGSGVITIDTTQTSLREPAGVSVNYLHQGERLSKVISTKAGFRLGKSFLFSEAISGSYPKVTVMYYQDKNDPYFTPSFQLGSFVPYYVNEAALHKELKVIINSLKASTPAKTVDEVIHYLSNEYAPPVPENVSAWLVENKLLE